jgi:hypothetical protein
LPRRRKGLRNATPVETIEAIRQLTVIASDDLIAGILNRNGLRTGDGNRWTRERVCTTHSHRKIPPFKRSSQGNEPWLNLTKAAAFLAVSPKTLRLAAQAEKIKHLHPRPNDRGGALQRGRIVLMTVPKHFVHESTLPSGFCIALALFIQRYHTGAA